ncbi:ATP-binding protein [Lentilactobacillus hilgardii]|uniref:ATP-binding protein n=1 Tax=Lentilactobacillus hilgardii TaxID=1588 RepID=UPI00390C57F6
MIGNEVTLTTKNELNIVYSVQNDDSSLKIGQSILENQAISIPINKFFASHIGIFGNTGSGKSNTLHKLYLELFRSKFRNNIFKHSQFLIIDFNGEYVGNNMFGVNDKKIKRVFDINTKVKSNFNKIPVTKEYLFDADILSILFDARPKTQVPFLKKAMKKMNEVIVQKDFKFGNFVGGILKRILSTPEESTQKSLDEWITIAKRYDLNASDFTFIDKIQFNSKNKNYYGLNEQGVTIYFNGGAEKANNQKLEFFKLSMIEMRINNYWSNTSISLIKKLKAFLEFQKVFYIAWKDFDSQFIGPLFNRIGPSLDSLDKVIEIKDSIKDEYGAINVFSLVHANQEVTRLLPMIISKMFYNMQKSKVSGKKVNQTKHLIIDEAHNILNAEHRNIGDSWQDYRLNVFEEIIKEGRKFGFFLTLSSQRPADISQTIISQIHNFVIHRLVNENA